MSEVKVGVIFKSYEPLSSIRKYAIQTEESGFGAGFWIAEAYHWFRSYGLESRGCFTALAVVVLADPNLIRWNLIIHSNSVCCSNKGSNIMCNDDKLAGD